jgi:N-acetylglucosaminyldiphosphoundecaprenol N-acetyl-beta-D-mannosaminyltransferase
MHRGFGPDFFKAIMIRTADLPVKHFFCGGKEGVAEELKQKVAERFGNNRIVGTFCPPFREMTDAELQQLGEIIGRSGADIVWIGLSCPKQEKLAGKLAAFTQTGFLVAVGAAFDFHTDRVKQAPRWMQQSGLEWLFRLFMEPKRLYKRYFEIVPGFIWLNIKEFVDFYTVKKKVL